MANQVRDLFIEAKLFCRNEGRSLMRRLVGLSANAGRDDLVRGSEYHTAFASLAANGSIFQPKGTERAVEKGKAFFTFLSSKLVAASPDNTFYIQDPGRDGQVVDGGPILKVSPEVVMRNFELGAASAPSASLLNRLLRNSEPAP